MLHRNMLQKLVILNQMLLYVKLIKQYSISSGHCQKKYDDCNDQLKATYNKSLPEKSTSNICIKVNVLKNFKFRY